MRYKATAIILLLVIFALISAKCYWLNSISLDVDNLQAQLRPLKQKISKNSRIGFYCNDGQKYIYYLEARLIMAPNVYLQSTKMDTVLIMQIKGDALKEFPNYRVIDKSSNALSTIFLATKNK